MVICEVSERERERHQNQKVGAMANHKERKTRPLHNFDLPRLKWGTHKTLRCMKINSTPSLGLAVSAGGERLGFDRISSPSKVQGVIRNLLEQPSERRRSPPPPKKGSSSGVFRKPSPPIGGFGFGGGKLNINKGVFCDDGIDQVRKGEQRMKLLPPPHHPISEEEEEEETNAGAPSNDAARPWNLRTRRATCKAPNQTSAAAVGGASSKLDQRQPHQHLSSSLTSETPSLKSLHFRTVSAAAAAVTNVGGVEKEQRRKFSTLLARDEIEEDFWVMTGARPSRRPKKRPKLVQKQLDLLFPGLWLSEITVDSYRLPDDTEPKKKAVEKNSRAEFIYKDE